MEPTQKTIYLYITQNYHSFVEAKVFILLLAHHRIFNQTLGIPRFFAGVLEIIFYHKVYG